MNWLYYQEVRTHKFDLSELDLLTSALYWPLASAHAAVDTDLKYLTPNDLEPKLTLS